MKLATPILALAIALAPVLAYAQPASDQTPPPPDGMHHPGGRGFDAMDTNHDGVITLDEWKVAGRREERFALIDTDHDGRITREEMRAAMDKMRAWREQNGGGSWHHDGGDPGAPPPATGGEN